ncbi:MAG: aldo/keto reductase [Alphaproteobacteria bacterium]|nr:aldo/keto reductase [Alphaproteobacteria bacterium]
MKKVQWGIIGPGSIAQNFADGLADCDSGVLAALASTSAERRENFGTRNHVAPHKRYDAYEKLLADPGIDAVYISTPHPWHAEWAVKAMQAGKAVLVEKPAGMNGAEVVMLTEVAAQTGSFLMEAFMYRCHPQIARLLDVIKSGEIGKICHIKATFGFAAAYSASSRLYDRALGGGGILDVGCYPMSLARLVAGSEPITLRGTGLMSPSGVDEVAYAIMCFASGVTAEISCAVSRAMDNQVVVQGEKGSITLLDPWIPGRNAAPAHSTIVIKTGETERREAIAAPKMLFAYEAEVASAAIKAGKQEAPYPAMSWADSIGNNLALDRWRAELGYATVNEDPKLNRLSPKLIPAGGQKIPHITLPGMDRAMSQLVLGCDNKDDIASGAIVWDAWMDAGGNAFDTGFVYGGGNHEKVLGQWISNRGVAKDVVTIVKGAHTPYCLPDAIAVQLEISLQRLQLSHAPIYIMHRDNPEVPVGEFVDALNKLHSKGLIGIFGGSNWSVPRLKAANDYAKAKGLQPFRLLNNNLSLAVMEKPVWAGCVTSNTPETLAFLRQTHTPHLSWSSQARGYFLPEALRGRLPADTAPETCFGSEANAERRKRAEQLAKDLGVSAHNIATAWVLGQSFPSLALVGPRSVGEIISTLPGFGLHLTPQQMAWLNLEGDFAVLM